MDIREKLESHREQVRLLSQKIQELRNELTDLEAQRHKLCNEQEALLDAMLEDDEYRCPMCNDSFERGVMKLIKLTDHFKTVSYVLECPKCGLRTPQEYTKLGILVRWYNFINKLKGKNNG